MSKPFPIVFLHLALLEPVRFFSRFGIHSKTIASDFAGVGARSGVQHSSPQTLRLIAPIAKLIFTKIKVSVCYYQG